MALIEVELKDRSYPILVVKKDHGELKKLIGRAGSGGRTFVIADAQFWALHGQLLLRSIKGKKSSIDLLTISVSEKLKTPATVAQIQDYLLSKKISRNDLVIACGGGITSDLVGFAAATILRGVKWGVVTTTLMGMVDAAIGGKTGVNHRSGKNLLGAIWQPQFVYANVEYVQTLPPRELVSGVGEILKYAGLVGGPYLAEAEKYLAIGDLYNPEAHYRLVTSSAALKAQIVCHDEREENIRAYLNFGHTFGHAVELSTGYRRLKHGEAVIIGLLGALELGQKLGPRASTESKRYRTLVEQGVGLVPKVPLTANAIFRAMALDKKRDASGLRFVLIESPGKPALDANLPAADIKHAIKEMITIYSKIGGTHAPNSRR